MGYILLPPEYINSCSEDSNIQNWHIFNCQILNSRNHYSNNLIDFNPICNKKNIYNNIDIDKLYKKELFYFIVTYNFYKLKGAYTNNFIGKNRYYTNNRRDFFYTENLDIIRLLSAALGEKVCGSCIAHLYGDLDDNI